MKFNTLILSMLFIFIPACNAVTDSTTEFDTSLKPGADTATSSAIDPDTSSMSGTETLSAADSNTGNTIDTGASSDTGAETSDTGADTGTMTDYCLANGSECDFTQICVNTDSGYTCECKPEYVYDGGCITSKLVPCVADPAAPIHSTAVIEDTRIYLIPNAGWTTPGICTDWQCDSGWSGYRCETYKDDRSFISLWKVSSAESVTLPLVPSGEYDFTVSWGDGTVDTVTGWDDEAKTHQYSAGQYEVVINGTIKGWAFAGNTVTSASLVGTQNSHRIREIKQWGTLSLGNTSEQFAGCLDLRVTATDMPELSDTTSLQGAFKGCSKLVWFPSVNSWDMSGITDMSHMFEGATSFDGDLSSWNTANVTDMSHMFDGATSFTGDLSSWNTANVTDMSHMFEGATSFDGDLSSWNTANVTDMSHMFEGILDWRDEYYQHRPQINVFNQDISSWDTSRVTDMSYMFYGAILFNQDISTWNTSSVTNMSHMFAGFNGMDDGDCGESGCGYLPMLSAFNQDISSWDTSNVADMSYMFQCAPFFRQDISNWNTSRVAVLDGLFSCKPWWLLVWFDLSELNPDVALWDISKVTSMADMFYNLTLSSENYDKLLIAWESQVVQDDVIFSGGNSTYHEGAPADARARLIADHGWTIMDGGQI
ncbi:MAG: BspA family leucine-rich repeat surface protein [Deltaproteobacteria bacterium]|nr:BspA family leucine-rich repeat surface protein [Deltaproteobacteria bacterium]